jgi:hypothetical protein
MTGGPASNEHVELAEGVEFKDSWLHLRSQSQYQIRRIAYISAGLGGLGVIGAATAVRLFDEHILLRAIFLSSAFLTAACLALSWERCQRLAAEVERDHWSELGAKADIPFPKSAQVWYLAGFVGLGITAGILVFGAWVRFEFAQHFERSRQGTASERFVRQASPLGSRPVVAGAA